MVGIAFRISDVALQVGLELGLGGWKFADLLTLREEGQPSPLVIEVLDLELLGQSSLVERAAHRVSLAVRFE
jgi:hypothetical protein